MKNEILEEENKIDSKYVGSEENQLEIKEKSFKQENKTESLQEESKIEPKPNEEISQKKILQSNANENIKTLTNGSEENSASENCDKVSYEFDDGNVEKCNHELFKETFIQDLSEANVALSNENSYTDFNNGATSPKKNSTTLEKEDKKSKMAKSFSIHRCVAEDEVFDSDDDDSSTFDFSSNDQPEELTYEDILDEKEENLKALTAGELGLEDLPPIEYLKIEVSDDVELQQVGTIHSIIDVLLIVKGQRGSTPLDVDSVLMGEDRKVIGQVFEIFGPVVSPFYSIRFNSPEDVVQLPISSPVFYAPKVPDWTKPVFQHQLRVQGSDASWMDNNEPPEELLDYSDDEEEVIARRKFEEEKGEESHSIRNMEKSIGLSKSRKKEKRNFKKEKPRHKKTWMGNSFGNKRQDAPFMKPNHTPFSSQAIRQSNFQPNFTSPNNYFSPQPSTNMYPNLQQKILQQQKNIIQQQQQLELLKAQLVQGAQQSPSTQVFQQGNTAPLSYHSSHTTPPPFILPHHQAFNHLFASQAIFNNPLSSPHPPTNATFKPFNHASSFGAYNNFNT